MGGGGRTGGGVGNGDQYRSLRLFAGIDSAVDLTGRLG